MNPQYAKKLIISSLILTLLMGGGLTYGQTSRASAAARTDSASQNQPDQPGRLQELKQKIADKLGDKKNKERKFPIIEEAAAILGVDQETLTNSLKDKTLVEVAKEKGISEADLVAKLQAARAAKIDEAVKNGKLEADKAEKIKANMSKHLSVLVNKKGLSSLDRNHHTGHHRVMKPSLEKIAAILGMSEQDVKEQLKAGKSLEEIARTKGITKDQLIAKIKEELTPMIQKMVEHKRGANS